MISTARPVGAVAVSFVRLALLALGVTLPDLAPAQQAQTRSAVTLDVRGAIGPATTGYLKRGLAAARERDAALVILRLDTPGGLDLAMREIIQAILSSPVPVATYVAPSGARAASAGTYILYASHLAAMAPGTNLGAATPVQLGGSPQPLPEAGDGEQDDGESPNQPAQPDAHTAKAVNDAVAYIRGLAALRGRNADWAEQAVRQAASLPAREALEKDVIDIVAVNLKDLLAQADGRTVRLADGTVTLATAGLDIVAIEPDWREHLLSVITDPTIAYILLLIGIYGIIFEFLSPGVVFPGVLGAISLVVALFALNLLPINYTGIGLMILGIALMVAEAFVPSFAVLGIGGAIAFALGSIIMFGSGVPGFELSLPVVLTATGVSAILLILVVAAVVRAHRRKVVSGQETLVGNSGRVLSWSGNEGQVLVQGEHWHARSAIPLAPGDPVTVTARDGLILFVEPDRTPAP